MDVAHWLRQLGLERYEAAFRENDVSAAILSDLTAEDLKELGVVSVGHRRQLLEAIATLRTNAPSGQCTLPNRHALGERPEVRTRGHIEREVAQA